MLIERLKVSRLLSFGSQGIDLRYLCLLAILLHPEPPPLIALEEPELGLHPDLIPQVAKLLVAAAERTQLIVTTHSDVLIDALTAQPASVIVCEYMTIASRAPNATASGLYPERSPAACAAR